MVRPAFRRFQLLLDSVGRYRRILSCFNQRHFPALKQQQQLLQQQCYHHQRLFYSSSVAAFSNLSTVSAVQGTVEAAPMDDNHAEKVPEGKAGETVEDFSSSDEASVPAEIFEEGISFEEIDKAGEVAVEPLPTVIILGRPNVGKSALFNRLVRKREALVYDTPESHVTRDIREGLGMLSDLRFKLLDSAGLETSAEPESVLSRTTGLTASFLNKCHIALLLIDGRAGLHPLDTEVAQWLRKLNTKLHVVLVVNKAERMNDDVTGRIMAAIGESYSLGLGDPVPMSAETGEGMADLFERLLPLLDEAQKELIAEQAEEEKNQQGSTTDKKIPLQFAIAGRTNVGKSTLINTLLQQERVLTGPEPGLTRDSIRVDFEFEKRPVYLVDTAGWMQKSQLEEGPMALSAMLARRSLMRSHVVALVLDGEEIAKTRRAMRHSEATLARWVTEEGRALVIIVNKMDLLEGRENAELRQEVMDAVPKEIQQIIPQVIGVPIVFVSALKSRGRSTIMKRAFESYDKWCTRVPTPRLNRWLHKVLARHPKRKDEKRAKPRFITQVKARPPTFILFVAGFFKLEDHELRFIANALREDFKLGGIPLRVLQRTQKEREGV